MIFFSLNKKASPAKNSNASDCGLEDDEKQKDQSAAEDCHVEETTDEIVDWIACNSCKGWWHTAAIALIMIHNSFHEN